MDILDQLMSEVQPTSSLLSGCEPEKPRLQKLRYTHDAMIDLIITNPAISQNELASRFGYSASWVSTVIASDAFQAKLADRLKELVDPVVLLSVQQRFDGLVMRSLEILQDKLNRPSDQIPDQLAIRALEVSTRAAGYGAKDRSPVSPVSVHVHLEQHSERLVGLLRRKREEIDNPVIEALTSGS